ncbi:MAG: AAA family ATPase [Bacillus subtilis]|nr:AAA family ATPase [Bacillus subtilis]
MLKKLTVRQFAIIDDITIEFQPGMTVLTGETGAGKSLLIDAIALILGDRASADMIRTGADRSEITAVFTEANDRVIDQLRRLKAVEDDRTVTIYRDITLQNKNTIRINRVSVTLQQLRDVTKHLADVHSQFDTQRLINPLNYLGLIDGFKPELVARYLVTYAESLQQYKQSLQAWKALLHDQKDLTEKLEIYRYQRDELKKLNLNASEKETLTQETNWMQNFDKVFRDLTEIRRIFADLNLLDGLYDIKSLLGRLGQTMTEFQAYAKPKQATRTTNSMI